MIKNIRHVVLGISFSPTGFIQGAKSTEEANKIVSDIGKDYDEVQTHIVRQGLDERGDPSFVLNEYIFIKDEDAPTAKSK